MLISDCVLVYIVSNISVNIYDCKDFANLLQRVPVKQNENYYNNITVLKLDNILEYTTFSISLRILLRQHLKTKMDTAIEIKMNEVKESIVITSNKLTEESINNYLDAICLFRNMISDCKEKLSNLNITLYDELYNHEKLYLLLKGKLKKLRNSLIQLIAKIKKNNHLYLSVKTVTKELSDEISLFNEIVTDLELKNEILPANKTITELLSSIE